MGAVKKPRASYHHGDLPRALVAAAVALVDEGGDETLTLRAVAQNVGVNHRAVYRHFADKRALLAAVALEGNRNLLVAVDAALAKLPKKAHTRERLLAIVAAYATFALSHPSHYRVMFGPRLNEDGRFPELEVVLQRALVCMQVEIGRGVEADELPPQDLLKSALSLWSAMHGVSTLLLERRLRAKPARAVAFAVNLLTPLVKGFATP